MVKMSLQTGVWSNCGKSLTRLPENGQPLRSQSAILFRIALVVLAGILLLLLLPPPLPAREDSARLVFQ
ncbi:MAG: hypothetical protein KJ814_00700, partial [Proteobacteria bacterium]|nr:hypothetical protein [Pseudomonadota bacterium]